MEPTADLMEAIRAMGQRAIPRLVEIGLAPRPGETRRTILSSLENHMPWLASRLADVTREWMSEGDGVWYLAREVIYELHPSSIDLLPCLKNRLSNPHALMLLAEVSDEHEATASLISAQIGADGRVVVDSLERLGPAGAAAKHGFVRYLQVDGGQLGRDAFRGLCHLGPGAQDCLPELRAFYHRQTKPIHRIHLAIWVGALDPGPFWAESELRGELESSDTERVAGALRTLKAWPYLVPLFESDLRQIAMTGVGQFDPFDIAESRRDQWLKRVTKQRTTPNRQGESIPIKDLAARAGALLEFRGR